LWDSLKNQKKLTSCFICVILKKLSKTNCWNEKGEKEYEENIRNVLCPLA